jgi:Fur family peroxide stress response transcriptional regulator
MEQRLREKRLKVTPQRLAVIDALVANKLLHPSASQVFQEVKRQGKRLSLSTTYATLHEFSQLGLIMTLEFDQMDNRYDVNPEEHVNLICEGCGKIIDYPVPQAVNEGNLLEATGFQVHRRRLECYGLCRGCRRGD